jgi:hypothetical protein
LSGRGANHRADDVRIEQVPWDSLRGSPYVVTDIGSYRVAHPSLREISQAIERHADLLLDKVTASPETVRRMIIGKVLAEQERLYVRRLPRALRHGRGRSGRRALGRRRVHRR